MTQQDAQQGDGPLERKASPRDPAVVSEELRRLIDDIAPTEVRREMAQALRRELVKAALQRGADKMLAGMAEAQQVRAALPAQQGDGRR